MPTLLKISSPIILSSSPVELSRWALMHIIYYPEYWDQQVYHDGPLTYPETKKPYGSQQLDAFCANHGYAGWVDWLLLLSIEESPKLTQSLNFIVHFYLELTYEQFLQIDDEDNTLADLVQYHNQFFNDDFYQWRKQKADERKVSRTCIQNLGGNPDTFPQPKELSRQTLKRIAANPKDWDQSVWYEDPEDPLDEIKYCYADFCDQIVQEHLQDSGFENRGNAIFHDIWLYLQMSEAEMDYISEIDRPFTDLVDIHNGYYDDDLKLTLPEEDAYVS